MTDFTPSFGARATALVNAPHVEEQANNPSASQSERIAAQASRRIPMSAPQAKLACPALPGWHVHWINDTPGRILQAQTAGYVFVDPQETHVIPRDLAGESSISGSTDLGSSRVSVVVGSDDKGQPIRAYLMKLPEELYRQDQEALQQRNDGISAALRQGRLNQAQSRQDAANTYVKTVDLRNTFQRSI